jgi:hypothetical protein
MKKSTFTSVGCLAAAFVLVADASAASFGPRALHVSATAPSRAEVQSVAVTHLAGPRSTIAIRKDLDVLAQLAATERQNCADRRFGPRATACL